MKFKGVYYNVFMPAPVLTTKLYAPSFRSTIVLRAPLVERLNMGLALGRKLTLISAPAGFGKTTLVCEWIADCKRPTAWLSLDEADNDPIRFFTYLIAALQTLAPNIGAGLLNKIQSPQTLDIELLLTTLINEIAAIPNDFIFVLDDYHMLDSKPVDQALNFLVEHLPNQMHLVITTREDPLLPLARLRARNQLTELRATDLRFTPAEAADFLNRVMGLNLSTESIAALEARTEGWIAGLQLAALSMQGYSDAAGFIRSFSGAHQFVLDYLVEEVLQKQPENLQRFLLCTSILDRLSGSVCDALWQDEKSPAQETLEYLERANLFVISLDNERRWYRYHHLFRDLLRQRLSQMLTKEAVAQIHTRASEWFEQNGDLAEAFHHAIAATDFDRAANLAESAWLGMDENFQMAIWLGWVNQLPVRVRRVRPVLCTQIGWAHMDLGNVEASESSLREAEECLKHPRADMVIVETVQFRTLPARIAIARAYNAQAQNQFADTVRYAEMAQDLAPPDDEFMHAQASAILSGTYWASGELDKAHAFMSSWVDVAQQAGNVVFAVAASFGKADILITQGRLRDAIQVYRVALDLAATHRVENFTSHHHVGLGLLYHEMGDDEHAAQHLQKGFELGIQATIVDWMHRKSLAQAQLKESEGDLTAALDFLNEAQRFYVRTPIPNLRPVNALKAQIYLKQGYLLKAQEWAQKSGLSLHDMPDHLHEFERLVLARLALAEYQNDHDERHVSDVLKALNSHLHLAKAQNRLRSQIEILILQSYAYQAQGDSANAISALEQALSLAEPEGYLRFFVNEGEPLRLLMYDLRLTIGRAAHPLLGYVEKFLAVFPQSEQFQAPKSKSKNLKSEIVDPLSERELEVLRLVADGLSNDEISQKLFLALSTVKGHNLRIFGKLQAKNRTEAVARARELGLL